MNISDIKEDYYIRTACNFSVQVLCVMWKMILFLIVSLRATVFLYSLREFMES